MIASTNFPNFSAEPIDLKEPPYKNSDFLLFFKGELTRHELSEIIDYPMVYYWGQKAEKIKNKIGYYGFDDEKGNFIVQNHDHIAYRYEVLMVLGKGVFGEVFECFDHKDSVRVAMKIIKNKKRFSSQAHSEIKILKLMLEHDPNDSNHVLHIKDYFLFRNHICITSELLGINLYQALNSRSPSIFVPQKLRTVASQILKSLKFLKRLNIIHCDLKPENILFVEGTFSIKIIDFGLSCLMNERILNYIQSRSYRAPEVVLGLPYDFAIDIWSMGCILFELSSGKPLFLVNSEEELLQKFVKIKGQIPQEMASNATKNKGFFEKKALKEDLKEFEGFKVLLKNEEIEFVDFIEKCLEIDPAKRISVEDALNHPWIKGQLIKPKDFQFKIQRSKKKNLIINCL